MLSFDDVPIMELLALIVILKIFHSNINYWVIGTLLKLKHRGQFLSIMALVWALPHAPKPIPPSPFFLKLLPLSIFPRAPFIVKQVLVSWLYTFILRGHVLAPSLSLFISYLGTTTNLFPNPMLGCPHLQTLWSISFHFEKSYLEIFLTQQTSSSFREVDGEREMQREVLPHWTMNPSEKWPPYPNI